MANNAHGYPGPSTPRAEGDLTRPALSGSARIVTQLRRAILDGGYGFRERVPSERELATEYGAARGTVRTALKQLEDMNLVIRRPGSGTFVRYRGHADEEDIAEQTSPLELIEVRFAIEPPMTRLAAINGTAREFEQLAGALERLEACGGDQEVFSREDEAFHLALAEGSRNPLMVWLYRRINEVRGHKQWNAMKDTILTPSRIRQYNEQHRALYEALVSRNIDGAVGIITSHLEKARSDLLGAAKAS